MRIIGSVTTAMLLATVLSGCLATKGQLRKSAAEQNAALVKASSEHQAALDAEKTERATADQRFERSLQELRNDLEGMRKDFGAKIQAVSNGLQFALPVHFAFDESSVRAEDDVALERFSNIVSKYYGGATVTIEGFSDPAGSQSYNRRLSQKRADAVKTYLVSKNIQARLRTVGMGETRLVVAGAAKDKPGAELNRRVTFVIESPSAANSPVALNK